MTFQEIYDKIQLFAQVDPRVRVTQIGQKWISFYYYKQNLRIKLKEVSNVLFTPNKMTIVISPQIKLVMSSEAIRYL